MNVILGCVKFRRACKKLPALESPVWLEAVKAVRELDESLGRLTLVIGERHHEDGSDTRDTTLDSAGLSSNLV